MIEKPINNGSEFIFEKSHLSKMLCNIQIFNKLQTLHSKKSRIRQENSNPKFLD
jgi:hypothetical protein